MPCPRCRQDTLPGATLCPKCGASLRPVARHQRPAGIGASLNAIAKTAARLCGEAKGGQVLVTSRVAGALEDLIECEEVGALPLKGLLKPVPTYSMVGLRPTA